MASVTTNGYLQAGGSGCGCGSDADGGGTTIPLAMQCARPFQSVVSGSQRVQTAGAVGDEFVEVPMLDAFVGIELLYVKTTNAMRLCIDAGPAELESDALTLPTGFGGGEALTFIVDDTTTVPVVFDVADQSLAQVVARINAACALAGLPTPRCEAVGSTKLKLIGVRCGLDPAAPANASVEVTVQPPEIPFTTTQAFADGAHLDVNGMLLVEFPSYPNAPRRLEVSGQGTIEILAAGRTSA